MELVVPAVDDTPPTEVRVVATDDFGATGSDEFRFEAQNVAPEPLPALTQDGAVNCRPTLRVGWSDPGSADTHSATVDWGDGSAPETHDGPAPVVARHLYETAGVYTVYATVRDDDGGSRERALSTEVLHRAAVAQPINADGSSRFKNSSTIAIRAQIARCDGRAVGNLRPRFSLEQVGGPLTPAREVVNVTSLAGIMGNPGQVAYAAGKAGVVGLTRSLAKEWGALKINVNAVAFGFVDTPMTQVLPEEVRTEFAKSIELRRAASPSEAADGIYFLCSPASNYVHGQVLNVSGGLAVGMGG